MRCLVCMSGIYMRGTRPQTLGGFAFGASHVPIAAAPDAAGYLADVSDAQRCLDQLGRHPNARGFLLGYAWDFRHGCLATRCIDRMPDASKEHVQIVHSSGEHWQARQFRPPNHLGFVCESKPERSTKECEQYRRLEVTIEDSSSRRHKIDQDRRQMLHASSYAGEDLEIVSSVVDIQKGEMLGMQIPAKRISKRR